MAKKFWLKGAMLALTAGTLFQFGLGGGCLNAVVQRILVAVSFD